MAKIKYNITVATGGTYQKNGETKKSYKNVGMVMEKDDNSRFIMIDPFFNFAAVARQEGRDMVICNLMEPKEKESKPQQEAWEE